MPRTKVTSFIEDEGKMRLSRLGGETDELNRYVMIYHRSVFEMELCRRDPNSCCFPIFVK